ncbi:Metallo-dependent hydrolase [Ascobolus immersus RN42]|uniref:Metallo-dependent hydrolase n=1 Tax=Ascobolus immersus RN42 TaxID=1160509 RepID=A0A3N4IMB9_ASCIM|nr:Metallo-dependent hydrolase [Ascobolus immersus RN42]
MPREEPEPLNITIPDEIWQYSLYDAHCHPTDTPSCLPKIPKMRVKGLCVMGTRFSDQVPVKELAAKEPTVIPSFGLHPWFSHYLYDDSDPTLAGLKDDMSKLKSVHYFQVLQPDPEAHFINDLPDPVPLSEKINELRELLKATPNALVGEIGLDKSFRIPVNWSEHVPNPEYSEDPDTPAGSRGGRRLSPYRVSAEHQKKVFVAQVKLAGELGRGVSAHSVKAHGGVWECLRELWKGHEVRVESKRERKLREGRRGVLLPENDEGFDFSSDEDSDEEDYGGGSKVIAKLIAQKAKAHVLDDAAALRKAKEPPKPYPPRVCLHSCSAPLVSVKQFLTPPDSTHVYPSDVYFSFSTTVNSRHMGHLDDVIKAVPEDRILSESDLHKAGEEMETAVAEAVVYICKVRGWDLKKGCEILERNWKRFVTGEE